MTYSVTILDGREWTIMTFAEARKLAAQLKDEDPFIDQLDDVELTGVYWHYVNGILKRRHNATT